MKKYLLIITLISGFVSQGQLIVNPQMPPNGIVQKNQLWNMMVTNTYQSNISASITMTMTNYKTGEQILGASTAPIIFTPGTTMLNSSQLMPIHYNFQLGGTNNADMDQNGFLPLGNFLICYTFNGDSITKIALPHECIVADIEPLSPPQLIVPEDEAAIDSTAFPQFSWIPPAPLNIFNDLKYDLNIVQVNAGQTATDAIQLNIPLLFQQDLSATSMVYPMYAPALQTGVQYAWQVKAKNNGTPVSSSETWVFTLGGLSPGSISPGELPFTRLMKNGESGYSICWGKLKFAYINETADTSWSITMYDISSPVKKELPFSLDSVFLHKGLNLVQYDLADNPSFIDMHIYLLELRNSRNEVWRMKFEYLKPQD